MVTTGHNPLSRFLAPREVAGSAKKWFSKQIPELVEAIRNSYWHRDEVVTGGKVSAGTTVSASVAQASWAAAELRLHGHMQALAAGTDADLFTTAGSVGQAIFEDGADASGISLGAGQVARVTVIACNSDGAGGAAEDDDGQPLVVAVVTGTSTTFQAETAHLSSAQVRTALATSTGEHAGVTAWVHLARAEWGAASLTVTLNRNNRAAKA